MKRLPAAMRMSAMVFGLGLWCAMSVPGVAVADPVAGADSPTSAAADPSAAGSAAPTGPRDEATKATSSTDQQSDSALARPEADAQDDPPSTSASSTGSDSGQTSDAESVAAADGGGSDVDAEGGTNEIAPDSASNVELTEDVTEDVTLTGHPADSPTDGVDAHKPEEHPSAEPASSDRAPGASKVTVAEVRAPLTVSGTITGGPTSSSRPDPVANVEATLTITGDSTGSSAPPTARSTAAVEPVPTPTVAPPVSLPAALIRAVVGVASALMSAVLAPPADSPTGSLLELGLLGWVRRELSTPGPELASTRESITLFDLGPLVDALLGPIPTAPSQSVSDDIAAVTPRPQYVYTVVNLTGETLRLRDFDPGAYNADGLEQRAVVGGNPQVGYVLAPWRTVEFSFLDSPYTAYLRKPTMTWVNDARNPVFTVEFQPKEPLVSNFRGNAFHLYSTPFEGTYPLPVFEDFSRQTLLFLPQSGRTVMVDPADELGKAITATYLCADGSGAGCSAANVSQSIFYTDSKPSSDIVYNEGTLPGQNSLTSTSKVTSTNSIDVAIKANQGAGFGFNVSLLKFTGSVQAVITSGYGHSWGSSTTYANSFTETIRPGDYGYIEQSDPMYLNTVDLEGDLIGTHIDIGHTEWISPVEDASVAAPRYVARAFPIGAGPYPTSGARGLPQVDPAPVPPSPSVAAPAAITPGASTALATQSAQSGAPSLLTLAGGIFSLADPFLSPVLNLFTVPAPSALAERLVLRLLGNPQTPGYTRGFEIVNLSSRPMTFREYTSADRPTVGPNPGFVLAPFEATRVEVSWKFLNNQDVGMRWNNGNGDAIIELRVDGATGIRDPRGRLNAQVWDDANAFDAPILYLLDPPGTVVDATSNPELGSVVANVMCGPDGVGSSPTTCGVDVTRVAGYVTDPALNPQTGTFANRTQDNVTHKYTTSQSSFQSNNYSGGAGFKVKGEVGAILTAKFELEFLVTYRRNLNKEQVDTYEVTQTIPPDYEGMILQGSPFQRVYGNVEGFLGNTRWIVRDVWIDNPLSTEEGASTIVLRDQPLAPPVA